MEGNTLRPDCGDKINSGRASPRLHCEVGEGIGTVVGFEPYRSEYL